MSHVRGLDIIAHCAIEVIKVSMISFNILNSSTPPNVNNALHSSNAWEGIFWLTSGTRSLVVHATKTIPTMWLITVWYALCHKCGVLLNLALIYLQTRPDFESHGRAQTGGVRRRPDVPDAGRILRYARRRTDSQPPVSIGQEDQSQPSGPIHSTLLDDSSSIEDSAQSGQVSQLCRTLAILTLRHEDALNALACQDQCILFLTQGAQGVTRLLIQAAQDWREQTTPVNSLRV